MKEEVKKWLKFAKEDYVTAVMRPVRVSNAKGFRL